MKYDAVVIGAGPAGSMAAYEIAAAGHSVLMVERDAKPGIPLCCAEGVGRFSFDKLITPRQEWISTSIDGVRVVAPDGSTAVVSYPGAGYVLDRRRFDFDLARRAVEAGCRLECNTSGERLRGNGDCFEAIELMKSSGERETVEAGIFIAADGAESVVARRAGINNVIDIDEVESILEYRVENISLEPNMIEFYVGDKVAPKGYLWVFPKSADSANIGLGLISKTKRSDLTVSLLDSFLKKNYPGGVVTQKIAGITPKYMGRKMFRLNNLLTVGDAARALDSLTGGGIVNAMLSGKLAGRAAAVYLSREIDGYRELDKLYPGRFLELKGDELSLYFKLKNVYKRLDDGDFIDVIKALNEYFSENGTEGINAGKLLAGLIRTRPRLIRLVKYLL